jgi:hypothetical protein
VGEDVEIDAVGLFWQCATRGMWEPTVRDNTFERSGVYITDYIGFEAMPKFRGQRCIGARLDDGRYTVLSCNDMARDKPFDPPAPVFDDYQEFALWLKILGAPR